MRKTRIGLFLCLFIFISSNTFAKNVILFIGDGMGPGQIVGARWYQDATTKQTLFLDTLPLLGLVRTHSANSMTTDSAAAITAMATGVKGNNNCLGLGPSCTEDAAIATIAEIAAEQGMASGVVTTTRITHATPAGFYAHVVDRDNEELVADQLLASPLTIALGGGEKYFTRGAVEAAGFKFATTKKELAAISPDEKVIGTFTESHFPYVFDRSTQDYTGPDLAEMTQAAIRILSQNPDGYILMVEGGMIDKASHINDARRAFEEVLELDRAIQVAAEMTSQDDTVILVTADHETAGLTLNGYSPIGASIFGQGGKTAENTGYPIIMFATGPGSKEYVHSTAVDPLDDSEEASHTALDVNLYGLGLDRDEVRGTIENTEIFQIIRRQLFNDMTHVVGASRQKPLRSIASMMTAL